MIKLVRTNSQNTDFIKLVKHLDAFLKITDQDEHDFYNQFNGTDAIKHVLVAYNKQTAVGCAAFKAIDKDTVELKRMFTLAEYRAQGIATQIILDLERWASELKYKNCILETGIRQIEAVQFYKKNSYKITPNYGQYIGVKNSLCFEKTLVKNEK